MVCLSRYVSKELWQTYASMQVPTVNRLKICNSLNVTPFALYFILEKQMLSNTRIRTWKLNTCNTKPIQTYKIIFITYLFKKHRRCIVQVFHDVIEQQKQSWQVKNLWVLQRPSSNFWASQYSSGHQKKNRFLLHKI